ncbi:Lipoprotein-releasing system ATP-binding protein LolD [Marinomonas gallaica]|uniref:Lipoprotein-releasing system ATP-binding protein LolD n=1 Tax=Marinomonas gallaica TaxID=1806667 RepID=A0A1C3JU44_9GAMM|nr:ABC transporter ATP-binding protein [Marinomonas gallaica]SBT18744.1 Lipoprotein-releasing system ATP-binding protein LolD [Marinomonas gallaica]SBT21699.1 Lipoprotein-releasing system ATP-binding protein LolD [Marinomonas gallaica]
MSNVVLSSQSLGKQYRDGKRDVQVFEDINFELKKGEAVAIVGSSGSGKTTLLNLLAGLDKATTGAVEIEGQAWDALKDAKRSKLRNEKLGFVYQFHHLLPEFSAVENVMMPLLIAGEKSAKAKSIAAQLLSDVGLSERLDHRPAQLSGGERQRVAIARALAHDPACVLMDEPTGNLDETTSKEIQELIVRLKQEKNMAFLIVTHDEKMLSWMDRAYRLSSKTLQLI